MQGRIQGRIADVFNQMANTGDFEWPFSIEHSVLFLVSEVGELADALLRQHSYMRNHSRNVSVKEELADVIIMAYVTGELLGIDVDAAVEDKLQHFLRKMGITVR